MKINHSRRKFLNDTSRFMSVTAYMFGIENLLGVLLQQSVARASDAAYPYKYVNIITPLGPPRWYFDQALNPSGQAGDFETGSFGTQLKKVAGKWKSVYETLPQQFGGSTVHMAPIWNLKSVAGEKFSSLLDNAVIVRGLNMEIDGHDLNQQRNIRPFAAAPSVSGMVGAASTAPTPSIGFNTARTTRMFKSPGSVVGVAVNKATPVKDLILPFNVKEIIKKDDLDYSIKQALSSIDKHVAETGMSSNGAGLALDSTYDIFSRNLDAYQAQYTTLYQKYKGIVDKEFRAEFPGVNTDLASISPDGTEGFSYATGKKFNTGTMKSIVDDMTPPGVAEAFAFIEFALKENLTSSLTVDLGAEPVNNPAANGGRISNDQHFVGNVVSTVTTSLFYRCTLGCMAELRKSLTSAGIFDKTVIHMTAEFSRTPQGDGAGSDHGFESSATTIISGMIKKGAGGLIGNVGRKHSLASMAAKYPGTWGHSRPTDLPDGTKRDIINDDVVCTVCEMLQIPKIGTKGVSLVKNQDDVVTLLKKGHSNVA